MEKGKIKFFLVSITYKINNLSNRLVAKKRIIKTKANSNNKTNK